MGRLSGETLRFQIGEKVPYHQRNPCWRKDRFITLAAARQRVAHLTHIGHHQPERGELRPYGCDHCGHFHIGHGKERGTR